MRIRTSQLFFVPFCVFCGYLFSRLRRYALTSILLILVWGSECYGAKIGDLSETDVWDQAMRFFSFQDTAVRYTVLGTIFMGISCGLLGSFIVVRKLALVGDTMSHAVLPGVVVGFMWSMEKDPIAIFIGATISGVLGIILVSFIKQTTHIKEDSALGMVLTGFFAIGICLMKMIERIDTGNKSGLDKFMFGQAAALSENDVILMGWIALGSIVLLIVFYKELLVSSFDMGFARVIGVPVRVFHYLLMLFLSFSVVVSLQATGVVLVSALLIIPASTAYLLTDRMHIMLILAALFGSASAVVGAFLSFLGNDLPTGPFMVLGSAIVFLLAFLFGPRYGIVPRRLRHVSREKRIQLENTLKAAYQVLEKKEFKTEVLNIQSLANRRNLPVYMVEKEVEDLVKGDHATIVGKSSSLSQETEFSLTPDGWLRACQIVRNHRLWELYLTSAAHYESDHVHDDAERIEHILDEDTVRKLEKRLNNPRTDPHGKLIPSEEDVHQFHRGTPVEPSVAGYRQAGS